MYLQKTCLNSKIHFSDETKKILSFLGIEIKPQNEKVQLRDVTIAVDQVPGEILCFDASKAKHLFTEEAWREVENIGQTNKFQLILLGLTLLANPVTVGCGNVS